MQHLRAFFGCERAVCVTATIVQRYVVQRQAAKAANGTINRELHSLRRAFSLAVEHKRLSCVHVPEFPRLAEENVREGFVEKADFDSVLSHLRDRDVRDFVAWAFWTGMRRGEISKLTWAAFDRETSTLILPGRITKNGKPRMLVLEGIYRELIARRLSARRLDCPLIFYRQGKSMGAFRKAWANACTKAGVKGLLFHDLRRTAVRNMIRAGIDKTVAKRISGHRTDNRSEPEQDRETRSDPEDCPHALAPLQGPDRNLGFSGQPALLVFGGCSRSRFLTRHRAISPLTTPSVRAPQPNTVGVPHLILRTATSVQAVLHDCTRGLLLLRHHD